MGINVLYYSTGTVYQGILLYFTVLYCTLPLLYQLKPMMTEVETRQAHHHGLSQCTSGKGSDRANFLSAPSSAKIYIENKPRGERLEMPIYSLSPASLRLAPFLTL